MRNFLILYLGPLIVSLFLVCSQAPVAPGAEGQFTVCNTVPSENVSVYTGVLSYGTAIPQTFVCTILSADCVPVDVPDGTLVVCVTSRGTFAKEARKGEVWDL